MVSGIDKWKNREYFFSHITEIIRLATLWKYGGVYLDTDVVVMKLDNLHNAVGAELAGEEVRQSSQRGCFSCEKALRSSMSAW